MLGRRFPQNEQEKLDWLRIIRTPKIGPTTFWKLMDRFGAAEEVIKFLIKKPGSQKPSSVKAIEKELGALEKLGAQLVHFGHPCYPPLLKQLVDAPPLLSLLGRVELLKKKSIAIVGARNASANALLMAQSFAEELGKSGFLITSGMAMGIDAAAHQGALKSGTAALLGGGIDVIYPRTNSDLYRELLERGVVVSEMPLGCQPQARHFPRRNRLVSGMSRGVLVIEAALKSGSMITAQLAQDQGRETMAIPGSPLDNRSRGCNRLIRDGAHLIETPQDVINCLNQGYFSLKRQEGTAPQSLFEPAGEGAKHEASNFFILSEKEGVFENTDSENGGLHSEDLTPKERVKNLLNHDPVLVDELIRMVKISSADMARLVTEMELEGLIERHYGNRISKVPF